jgi:hypothetical protein
MKRIPLRFFLTLVFTAGLGPGLGFGMGFAGAWRSPLAGVAVGFAAATLTMLWCAIWYQRAMRKRYADFSLADANAYAESTINLPIPAGEVFDLCKEAFRSQPGMYIQRVDEAAGEIEGLTGGGNAGYMSFGSPGERVSVRVSAAGEKLSQVLIKSRPGTFLVLLDFGKNRANVLAIARWLADAIETRATRQREATERAELERALTAAKLAALSAQIEPHFLYNTLANAQSLTRSDPVRAEKMLGHLITYLRASSAGGSTDASTLGVELDRVLAYLEVLKIRMGARLQVNAQYDTALREMRFPSMMLQTLVENAIKHGLEPKVGGGTISIKVERSDGALHVTVTDDGMGISSGTAGTGIGLKNIRERLVLLYQDRASLTLAPATPSGMTASIVLPAERPTDTQSE